MDDSTLPGAQPTDSGATSAPADQTVPQADTVAQDPVDSTSVPQTPIISTDSEPEVPTMSVDPAPVMSAETAELASMPETAEPVPAPEAQGPEQPTSSSDVPPVVTPDGSV